MKLYSLEHYAALCGVTTGQLRRYIAQSWLALQTNDRGEVRIIYDIVAAMVRRALVKNPNLPPLVRRPTPGRYVCRIAGWTIRTDTHEGKTRYHCIRHGYPVYTFSTLERVTEFCTRHNREQARCADRSTGGAVILHLPVASCAYLLRIIPRTPQNRRLREKIAKAIASKKERVSNKPLDKSSKK